MSDTEAATLSLRVAADRFLGKVGHWPASRWTLPRVALVHGLVQQLADLGAEAENRPAWAVPRLPNGPALPDQFRVMVADLLAAGASPNTLFAAAEAISTAQQAL